MSKLRSVNTGFWDDEYIGDLSRDEQLLFLYFLTNPLTNVAGAYKIARKVIRQHTGYANDELEVILAKFEKDDKAVYRDGWIVLTNFLRNQNLNGNMKKGVIAILFDTPAWVGQKVARRIKSSRTLSKGFEGFQTEIETLCNLSGTVSKDELEYEVEGEEEIEGEADPASLAVFVATVLRGVKKEFKLNILSVTEERQWEYYAGIAHGNEHFAAEFLECLSLLRQQKWRTGPTTAKEVDKNLKNLPKLREEIEKQNGTDKQHSASGESKTDADGKLNIGLTEVHLLQ